MDWLHITMPIAGIAIFWPGLVIPGFGVRFVRGIREERALKNRPIEATAVLT